MTRELWLGPILNDNRERLVERVAALVSEGRGNEFIYLAATKPLMDRVVAAIGERVAGGYAARRPNVFLLSGFSRELLRSARFESTGRPLPWFASIESDARPVQYPLFARIIAKLAADGELPSFGGLAETDGLVTSLAALVTEIQRAGKTAAEFRQIVERRDALSRESSPTADDDQSLAFDRDTARVFEEYERVMDANGLTDSSRDYLRALAILRGDIGGEPVSIPFLDPVRLLLVDGLYDILPVHAELLRLVELRVPETVLNLNFDPANPAPFEAFRDNRAHLTDVLKFEASIREDRQPVAAGLERLRANLFNPDVVPDDEADTPVAVRVIEGSDRIREVRAIAKSIKRLSIDGVAAHKIAVVYRSRDPYEPIVRAVFADEGIASTISVHRPLRDVPAVRAALKVLEAGGGRRLRIDRIVGLLKTDYFSLEGARPVSAEPQPLLPFEALEPPPGLLDADDIENAVVYVGGALTLDEWLARAERLISDLDRQQSLTRRLLEENAGVQQPNEPLSFAGGAERAPLRVRRDVPVDQLRRASGNLDAVGAIVASIPERAASAVMAAAYRAALDGLSFRRGLIARARTAIDDEGSLERAVLDLRGLDALNAAIDAVVEASTLGAGSDVEISRADFLADLSRALEPNELTIRPGEAGGVNVLTASDVRGLEFPYVFIVGLVEGEFPQGARSDWIYPQTERANLRRAGLPLEDISPEESLHREEHSFYQAACRATERLWLTRPSKGDDLEDTIPSYFIAEVERALGSKLEREMFLPGFDGEHLLDASTSDELARSAVRAGANVRDQARRLGVSTEVVGRLDAFARAGTDSAAIPPSVRTRIDIEQRRDWGRFDEFDGRLANEGLRRQIDEFFRAHTFSATELSEYGNCGFKFFLKRVLVLEPRVEAALDLQGLDRGTLLHAILQRFMERFRGQNLSRISPLRLRNELHDVANEELDAFERGMPPLSPKLWRIERDVLFTLVDRFLDDELEHQKTIAEGGTAPANFELGFGILMNDGDPESKGDVLTLSTPDGSGIRIRGKIDRVDRAPDGTVVAYDYKTGLGYHIRDMIEGRDMQLAIYLAALEQVFGITPDKLAGGAYYSFRTDKPRRNNGLYRKGLTQYHGMAESSMAHSNLEPEAFDALRETIENIIRDDVAQIRDANFSLVPSLDEVTCSYCDYKSVCRFNRHRIRRKRKMSSE